MRGFDSAQPGKRERPAHYLVKPLQTSVNQIDLLC
jgi:hypothetical protein